MQPYLDKLVWYETYLPIENGLNNFKKTTFELLKWKLIPRKHRQMPPFAYWWVFSHFQCTLYLVPFAVYVSPTVGNMKVLIKFKTKILTRSLQKGGYMWYILRCWPLLFVCVSIFSSVVPSHLARVHMPSDNLNISLCTTYNNTKAIHRGLLPKAYISVPCYFLIPFVSRFC